MPWYQHAGWPVVHVDTDVEPPRVEIWRTDHLSAAEKEKAWCWLKMMLTNPCGTVRDDIEAFREIFRDAAHLPG